MSKREIDIKIGPSSRLTEISIDGQDIRQHVRRIEIIADAAQTSTEVIVHCYLPTGSLVHFKGFVEQLEGDAE